MIDFQTTILHLFLYPSMVPFVRMFRHIHAACGSMEFLFAVTWSIMTKYKLDVVE